MAVSSVVVDEDSEVEGSEVEDSVDDSVEELPDAELVADDETDAAESVSPASIYFLKPRTK